MNFEYAKENMIKQQILPEGVPLGRLIEAIQDVPREKFLPKGLESLAYSDSNFTIGGREIKNPMVTARILDSLNIKEKDSVLKLGLECGYTLALIAKLAETVDVLDYSEESLTFTKRKLASIGLYNVEFNNTEYLKNIFDEERTYDCVYISNTVREKEIDESLLKLLKVGGRMCFIVKTAVCDKAFLVTKTSKDEYNKKFLFDIYNK